MEFRTVLLVKSRDVGWAAVDVALGAMPGVRVIGEATSAGRGVDLATTLRPDAILSATIVDGIEMRPLLADLRRGPCPSPIVVLFGQRLEAAGVREDDDMVVAAHLLWGEISADTLGNVLSAVLSGEVIVASRPVYEAFVRGRPYLRTAPDEASTPTLTPREQAVLRGLVDGGTREQIAATAGVSRRTVARTIGKLQADLAATSTYALMAKAGALDLVSDDEGTVTG